MKELSITQEPNVCNPLCYVGEQVVQFTNIALEVEESLTPELASRSSILTKVCSYYPFWLPKHHTDKYNQRRRFGIHVFQALAFI